MPLPWKSHPIYKLRATIFWTDVVGSFFSICSLIASQNTWRGTPSYWVVTLILLSVSAAFVAWDLCYYAHEKRRLERDGDGEDPKWPCKKLLIADFLMMGALLFVYLCVVMNLGGYYTSGGAVDYYANLATLISSVLHGVSLWQELKARLHTIWLESQQAQAQTCPRCAFEYIEPIDINVSQPNPNEEHISTSQSEIARSVHPGLSHIANLVRQLNRQAEGDLEAGRKVDVVQGPSRETEQLIPTNQERAENSNGYGSLEILTPSTDADVVVKKKKAPRKAMQDKSGKASKGKSVEHNEEDDCSTSAD
ncbi:MAG: hypothetical protein Q9227_005621 [Pyrenula ochraceoflavens]